MSNMTKNVLLIGGTAVATTIAIDLFTGGAVRAAFNEKMDSWRNTGAGSAVADGAAAAAEAVSNGAAAVADAING